MLSQMKSVRFATAVLVALALLCGSVLAKKPPKDPPPEPELPPINYEITWLTSPDGTYPIAWDIDNSGNVVGGTGGGRAFFYSAETGMQDLNDLIDPDSGWILQDALGINDLGQVVGMGKPSGERGGVFGFRFTPGFIDVHGTYVPPVVDRMELPAATHSLAAAVNDLGEVVGYSQNAAGNTTVFVYSDWSGAADLGIEPAGFDFGINNAGQVVGTTRVVQKRWPSYIAFRFTPGQGIETTTLINDPFSEYANSAEDINDVGEFTGAAVASRYHHAYRFSDQSDMVDLDEGRNTSYGRCINSLGDVGGELQFSDGTPQRGFLYIDEFGIVNLDDLVVGTAEDVDYWRAFNVFIKAINDNGQICGYVEGAPVKAFVLTPVPSGN